MRSIRLFLTLTIIAIITLVNFLSSLRGYRESMAEAETLFNEQLLEYALLISATLPANGSLAEKSSAPQISFNPRLDNTPDFRSTLVFQVLDNDGRILVNFKTVGSPEIVKGKINPPIIQ